MCVDDKTSEVWKTKVIKYVKCFSSTKDLLQQSLTFMYTNVYQEEEFTCCNTTCAPDAILKMKYLDDIKALSPSLTHQGNPVGQDIRASAWLSVARGVVANCLYQEQWASRRRKRAGLDCQLGAQRICWSMCHGQRKGRMYTECLKACGCGCW